MLLLFFIRIITLLMLIKNGQKCMNMEVNGEDPSNYSHGVRIINRRGIKLKDASSKQSKKQCRKMIHYNLVLYLAICHMQMGIIIDGIHGDV